MLACPAGGMSIKEAGLAEPFKISWQLTAIGPVLN